MSESRFRVLEEAEQAIVSLTECGHPKCQEWVVGSAGVARIEFGEECGEMGRVPWFYVYDSANRLMAAVAARHVSVRYQ